MRGTSVMCAPERTNADRIGVLLDGGLDDLFGCLVQTCVDDFHAGVPERPCDHLRAAVMTVEAGL